MQKLNEQLVQDIVDKSVYVKEARREWLGLMMDYVHDNIPNMLGRRQTPTEKELAAINLLLVNAWKICEPLDRIAVLRTAYVVSAYTPLWRAAFDAAHKAAQDAYDAETVKRLVRGLDKNYERANYSAFS